MGMRWAMWTGVVACLTCGEPQTEVPPRGRAPVPEGEPARIRPPEREPEPAEVQPEEPFREPAPVRDGGGLPPAPEWNGVDLDCADIGHPVAVTGGDPHGLDRDGDGVGCESS
jgi:hypothetical protein